MSGRRPAADSTVLLRRARDGDSGALRQLVLRRHQDLLSIIRADLGRATGVRTEPEDVLHDTYLKIIRGFDGLTGESIDAFVAWTRSIARNAVREVQRRDLHTAKRAAAREVVPVDFSQTSVDLVAALEGHMTSVSGKAVRLEALDALSAALALLPEHYREVIELRYLQGLSVEQAAERTERTRGAVLMISHRAMRKMATVIREFPLLTNT